MSNQILPVGEMSQADPVPWVNCEIALRLPADSKLPTISGCWRRLPDGRLESGYSLVELAMALSFLLDKEVDPERITETPQQQLKERLIAVTGGEVLHIQLKEKPQRQRDGRGKDL